MGYSFSAKLWEYPGKAAWHFITLPKNTAGEIKLLSSGIKRGFNSVKVEVAIGTSKWNTSIFPYSPEESYVLPIKRSIREKEDIDTGDKVKISITLVDFRS